MSEEFTERKQIFAGAIRKCPSCGAQITTDTAKCPSCGFVIEKEHASSAMEEFAKKFVSLKTDAEKKDFVETYPIPNNKEDIRGFLNYASSQRDKDYAALKDKVFWLTVWNNKCRLIVNQGFDVFGADSDFMQYLHDYKNGVENSGREIKKIKNKLLLRKMLKISTAALLMLAAAGVFTVKQKKHAELIAGCVVPKKNVVIDSSKYFEVLSDAKIETTNISKRVETDSDKPVWCLDTTATVEIQPIVDVKNKLLEKAKQVRPEYYLSPDFHGKVFFRTIMVEEAIACPYQSQNAVLHGFDNVHQVSEKLMAFGEKDINKPIKLEIRLTQIAGSRKGCENLAIKLHESGKFNFNITTWYDEYYEYYNNK